MRIALSEWRLAPDLIGQYAAARKISGADAEAGIRLLGERVQKSLQLKKSPLEISTSGVIAKGIAGVVGLDRDFEVEIAPKYAATDGEHWRQDLLFMSMLSKHGNLLLQNYIRATSSSVNDLTSLVAQVFLRMFHGNRRAPLKTYRFTQFTDFALDGEFDPEDLLLPEADGFTQHHYDFDTNNEYSATVKAAVVELCARVRDPALYSRLRAVSAQLTSVTVAPSVTQRTLPGRLRRWQALYDLSFDVARGFGLSPGDSLHRIPGFVVSTWQLWQDLVGRSLVLALGGNAAMLQHEYGVGHSRRNGKATRVGVTPDAVLVDRMPPLVVDAKYKGRMDTDNDGISTPDFYEVLAFMRAASAKQAVLIYPATNAIPGRTGSTEVLERVDMDNGEVLWAVALEVNGISAPGGFAAFVDGLKAQIQVLAPHALPIAA